MIIEITELRMIEGCLSLDKNMWTDGIRNLEHGHKTLENALQILWSLENDYIDSFWSCENCFVVVYKGLVRCFTII